MTGGCAVGGRVGGVVLAAHQVGPLLHETQQLLLSPGLRLPRICASPASASASPLITHILRPGVAPAAAAQSGTVRAQGASGSVQAECAVERRISVGQVALQGPREEMEDEVVTDADAPNGYVYAAIFDGHAGFSSARFLRDELYKDCLTALEGGTLLECEDMCKAEKAISKAFRAVDERLLSWLETSAVGAEKESGSTATVLFARSDRLVLAHVGDSRAVLSRGGKAEDLSSDHRPYGNDKKAIAEIKRIQEAGGWVSQGRVCGSLSVSRAFGDIPYKSQKQQMMDEGVRERRWTESFASSRNLNGEWVVATPDTSHKFLDEEVEFIILASDGLWDSFKSADAVQYVRKQLREHGDVQRASEEIAKEALRRKGQDNVTVVIIDYGRVQADPSPERQSWKWW